MAVGEEGFVLAAAACFGGDEADSAIQVVESWRNEAGKPRHRVVANLGRLDDKDGSQLDALIRGLCRVAGREESPKFISKISK